MDHLPQLTDATGAPILESDVSKANDRRVELPRIQTATPDDVRFIDSLQKKFANCVGFMPKPALDFYLENRNVELAFENGQEAGYILAARRLRWAPLLRPIYQSCVAMDLQRRHIGLALVQRIESAAKEAGQIGLQANCASDLDANRFWEAAGFKPIITMTPKNARKRAVICWRKFWVNRIPAELCNAPARAGTHGKKPQSLRNMRY